jgi:hypothetical protein
VSRGPQDRAAGLLRWYPRSWRARYGEEFAELLAADLSERPRCIRRTLDVAAGGLRARAAAAGLSGDPTCESPAGASLATLAVAVTGCLVCALAVWSQLAIGWRWSRPAAEGTTLGVLAMSATLALLAALVLLAAVPVGWAVARSVCRRARSGAGLPALGVIVGTAVLVAGARHFHVDWPGAGGHPWAEREALPGSAASYAWALTLSFSSYWAPPARAAALSGRPARLDAGQSGSDGDHRGRQRRDAAAGRPR